MKKLITILGTIVLFTFTSTSMAEVVIKHVPLKWQDVAKMDGGELFSNLCAACHGVAGKGDGPAISALSKPASDLTRLAANNDGVYSHLKVKREIYGESRLDAHGTVDMPVWGQQFMYVRSGWNAHMRKAYARDRINTLDKYIASIQVD